MRVVNIEALLMLLRAVVVEVIRPLINNHLNRLNVVYPERMKRMWKVLFHYLNYIIR
jgi:hypothetical protein